MRIQIFNLRFKELKNWLREERIKTPKFLKASPFIKLESYYTRTVFLQIVYKAGPFQFIRREM